MNTFIRACLRASTNEQDAQRARGLLDEFAKQHGCHFQKTTAPFLLAQTATVHRDPDLLLSVAVFTIIDYAEYSYAQK